MKSNVLLIEGARLTRYISAAAAPDDTPITSLPRYSPAGTNPLSGPAVIRLGDYGFDLTRAGVVKPMAWGVGRNKIEVKAVVIDDESAAALDRLDAEIAALRAAQLEIMKRAAAAGRPVTIADSVDSAEISRRKIARGDMVSK